MTKLESRPISEGERVRHSESWACGEVLRTNTAASVVRWDNGAESWELKTELEPAPD
jgi:hypothetical protein